MTGSAILAVALAATATGGAAAPSTPDGGATSEALPHKDVAPLVKQVFDTGFDFCKDPNYPLTRHELKWCELMPKSDARCPMLDKVCGRGATAEFVGREGHKPTTTISLPMADLPVRLLFWLVLALVVAFVIYTIAKHAVGQRAPDREETVEAAADAPEDPAAALARIVETDVQRLLDRARAAAAAGNYEKAIEDAYAALLRKLEGTGVITVESHRTNGDHVRDVARQVPALRPRMEAVVANVEEVQFGGGTPTDSRFRSVMLDVMGLLQERLASSLLVVVKVGLGLALAGTLAGCAVNRDRWDRSPSGRAGVVDLLERYGFTPRERLVALNKLDKTVSSMVILPTTNVDEAGWQGIASWTGDGGCLIVAGGVHKLPEWIGAKIVDEQPPASTPPVKPSPVAATSAKTRPPDVASADDSRLPSIRALVPDSSRIVEILTPTSTSSGAGGMAGSTDVNEAGDEEDAPAVPLLVRRKALYAVERTFEGGGRAIVIADDRLFENASLLVGDNGHLLIELLRPGGKNVEFADELTGLVSQNPVTSVQRGKLAPAMLQLALVIILFFVYKGAHFGTPIELFVTALGSTTTVRPTRRAFSDHVRALGLLYGRVRAGRHALESYGSYALERMRERLNLSGGKGLIAVAEEVATRTGRPLSDVMRVLVESRPNKRSDDPVRDRAEQEVNSAKDLATLRDLATLLQGGTRQTTGGAGDRIRSQREA